MNALGNQKKNTESGAAGSDTSAREAMEKPQPAGSNGASAQAGSASPLKIIPLLTVAGLIAVADQIVKAVVVHRLDVYESIPVIPGLFSIMHIHNPGIAFGMFQDAPANLFTVITLISMVVVVYFYIIATPRGTLLTLGCSSILGGALGNLVDRFRLGYVVDFINFSFWPAFNVADSAVTIGVALLMLSFFLEERGNRRNASDTV